MTKEEPTMTESERDTVREHVAPADTLCADGGDGCCRACGVSMTTCEECGGVGYHRVAPPCPYVERNGEGSPY